jgi:hypothetical protein
MLSLLARLTAGRRKEEDDSFLSFVSLSLSSNLNVKNTHNMSRNKKGKPSQASLKPSYCTV